MDAMYCTVLYCLLSTFTFKVNCYHVILMCEHVPLSGMNRGSFHNWLGSSAHDIDTDPTSLALSGLA